MRSKLGIVIVFAVSLSSPIVRGAESLSGEKVLPLHDGRDAYTPAVAFVKDGYLVAWQSGRLAPGDLREGLKFNGDIVGCRVSKIGDVLSKEPFVICGAKDLQQRPRIAAGKDVALVVWQDLRNGKDWDVYAARVSPEGKVLDPDGVLVSGGAHNQAKPNVAWDGTTFIVVWQDYRGGKKYEVYAARVDTAGKVLEPDGIKLSDQPVACYDPAVASRGDGMSFVIWTDWWAPHGPGPNTGSDYGAKVCETVILVDGKPEGQPFAIHDGDDGRRPNPGINNTPLFAAAGKDSYLVAWRTERPVGRGNGGIVANAQLFDTKGQSAPKTFFTLSGEQHRITQADLTWDGSDFVAAWTEMRTLGGGRPRQEHVFATRIGADGKRIGRLHLLVGSALAGKDDWAMPFPQDKRPWKYEGPDYGSTARASKLPDAPPAANAAVASDGAGTSLIAYEKHPETGDTPIKIGFRMLREK
jgi:hypothetical protein